MPGEKLKLSGVFRASEWWEYKLSPLFATIYATAFFLQTPLLSLWPLLVLVLLALVPGAVYVSVLNDLTDLQDDIASGKKNRLIGKSPLFIALLLAGCVVPGIAFIFTWRNDPLLLVPYLAAWVVFSLYSLPPIRLKNRGVWGVLADASGAHLFPTLVVVGMVYRWRDAPVNPFLFAVVAVWALCCGLRGILWHQLSDRDNDEKIGIRTLAQRYNPTSLAQIGNYIVFPVEIIAFGILLWLFHNPIAVGFLLLYVLLDWLRMRWLQTNVIIVAPRPNFRMAMQEYYELFFPLAFIIASALKYPQDALLIAVHLLVFPMRFLQAARDILKLRRSIWKYGL